MVDDKETSMRAQDGSTVQVEQIERIERANQIDQAHQAESEAHSIDKRRQEMQEKRAARKAAREQAKATRPKIFKWRGLLAKDSLKIRLLTFGLIVVCMASLTFTQLGFVGVGLPGNYAGYCVTLLAPVALAALLFGLPLGTLTGLMAGAILYAHSLLQPLDYFEVNFITPISSIVLFALTGFILSFLFAVALRGNPSPKRRTVYVIIVCLLVSGLFSLLFFCHALVKLVFSYLEVYAQNMDAYDDSNFLVPIVWQLMRMGSQGLQLLLDAALMALVCLVAFVFVDRAHQPSESRSLGTTFRVGFFVAVSIAFMITTGLSFVVTTEQAKSQAQNGMDSDINYLTLQIQSYEKRQNDVLDFIQKDTVSEHALSDEEVAELNSLMSMAHLLDGFTKGEDGTVLVFKDNKVFASDDEDYPLGLSWGECFGDQVTVLSGDVLGKMVPVAYDNGPLGALGIEETSSLREGGSLSQADTDKLLDRRITTRMAFARFGVYNNYVMAIMMPDTMVFSERTSVMLWTSLSAFILLLAVFLVAAQLLGRVVVKRIDETNGVLAKITDGNLNARVDIRDSREFKSLSTGINTTVSTLKSWISEAESRMDQDLATAKAIQESALPGTFPPYPDIHRFDIYASMNPAKEVGGDFYDFFLIGDNCDSRAGKLGFVIADVSGKGVPAALFMMAAKTEVRNYMESGMEPGESVENANRKLCNGNDAGMFVTLFAGVLDYATGHVQYVNAGHNPPMLWQAGSWHWMKEKSGLPLGLFDGFPYDTFELDLQIGDQFFLYTDGVTEAMNVEGELFGEERLEKLLSRDFTLHPRHLVGSMRYELSQYALGAEQSDDITILALEYGVPPELTSTLTVKADVDELWRVNDFVHTELDRRLCPVKVQKQLDIALEELFVNVARYAYPDATPEQPGKVRVSYTYSAEPPSMRVEIIDEGVPYNPLAKPDAVTPDDIEKVPIGGLGILMAKRSVDEMTYEYRDGSNVVAFVKKW